MSYLRFLGMIATAIIVMFSLTYLESYAIYEHATFSETRSYMAFLMGAAMTIIMLGFMWGMYKSPLANIAIVIGGIAAFGLTLYLLRSQVFVDQVSYMRAMIPHHSIAILTSERADIRDARVRKLADEIIEAQRREIAEMIYLIRDLEKGE